jgi:UDP-N-acetylmuramoyl-L-alanyl-D-glutamate--2,6-diaminopimelate ligase
MKLSELIKNTTAETIIGNIQVEVTGIEFDSRQVKPGTLFVAQRGVASDGHQFIGKAIANGAKAVVCEELPSDISEGITCIKVADSNEVLGKLAAAFFGFPSRNMKVVGVTGTNGKTSIATLLYKMFLKLGFGTGLISTIS